MSIDFSKLFETFYDWLRRHGEEEKEEEEEVESPKLIDFMLQKHEITEQEYLEFMGVTETPYETRIRRYMEKHPYATLKEARGHG